MSSKQEQTGDGRSQETWTPDDMQAPRIVVDSMTASPTIGKIADALAQAQLRFGTVKKDKEAEVKKDGKFLYKYTYADLASSIDATREALVDNGIAVIQMPSFAEGWVTVTTAFAHVSGEWMASSLTMSAGRDGRPQAIGSAITYARRYALQAMTGLATEDDDGAAAHKDAGEKPAPAKVSYADLRKQVGALLKETEKHTGRPQSELMEDVGIEKGKTPTAQLLRSAKLTLEALLEMPAADEGESGQAEQEKAAQRTFGDDGPPF